MYSSLFRHLLNRAIRYFRTRGPAKTITIALFMLVFLGIASGVYLFFYYGLTYINIDLYFGQALTFYVYELYFLVFTFLVVISSLITGLFGLYKGWRDEWIMASPQYSVVMRYLFIRASISALWPFVVIIIPALLAVSRVHGLAFIGFFIVLISAVLYTIFVVSATLIVLSALGNILRTLAGYIKFFRPNARQIISLAVIILAFFSWFTWQKSGRTDLVDMFHAEDLAAVTANLDLINKNFQIFPSHILARSVLSWQTGETGGVISGLMALFLLAAGGAVFWWRFSPRMLKLWQALQESSAPLLSRGVGAKRVARIHYRFRGGPIMALMKKELLVSIRNVRGLTWFGFLLFIWLVQASANTVLSQNAARHSLEFITAPTIIQVMQYLTAIFFVSAFVLRFVFPAFSAERRTAWILASAPVSLRTLFWAKHIFYILLFTIIGLLIGYSNIHSAFIPLGEAGITLSMYASAIIFIVTLGLALGAMYPSFETDDPAALSTSLPGLAFILAALLYGALGGYFLFLVLIGQGLVYFLLYEIFTAVLTILFLNLAPRKLSKIDFVKTI